LITADAFNDSIITNNGNDMEVDKSFIIYFKNFYKEPKMKTLSIKFADKGIILKDH
jgi:hypothetical protein